jgi:hypothetical protein
MLLSHSCIPCILSGIGAILTIFPDHLFSAPRSLVLLAVIIHKDFLTIPFLILVGGFMISSATDKTHINVRISYLGLGAQYQNLVLCTFLVIFRALT